MKTTRIVFLLCVLSVLSVPLWCGGCLETTDPATGESQKQLDPNAAAKAEAAAEGVIGIAPLFGSGGAGVAVTLAALLGIWRTKIKPQLLTARTEAQQYHAAAAASVDGLEALKVAFPDTWMAMEDRFRAAMKGRGIDPLIVENVIRGLRGLSPKDGSQG